MTARRCLWDAYRSGSPAEYISYGTTVEGRGIAMIYRVIGPGTVEVFVDQTKDLGPGSQPPWLRLQCTRLGLIADQPDDFEFGPDVCTESVL